jgi:hypothetical protein
MICLSAAVPFLAAFSIVPHIGGLSVCKARAAMLTSSVFDPLRAPRPSAATGYRLT